MKTGASLTDDLAVLRRLARAHGLRIAVKFVLLRLGVIAHVLAHDEALDRRASESQVSTQRLSARLVLALRRAPERMRERDLCEVPVQESDAPALTECLRQLASRLGVSVVEGERFLEAARAVDAAPARGAAGS